MIPVMSRHRFASWCVRAVVLVPFVTIPVVAGEPQASPVVALDAAVNAEIDQRLARRAAIETAEHQVTLVELQAKLASALSRCAEMGAHCGVGAGLESLSVPLPTPAADPEPIQAQAVPEVPESTQAPIESMSLPARPLPTPAPPRLMGVIGSRARFRVDGQLIDVAKGESLPGGWTLASLSLRGVTLRHANGDTRRLSLSWASQESGSAEPTASAMAAPPFLPLPGYRQ